MSAFTVKTGVKTWSDRPAETLPRNMGPQTMSADQKNKSFNGEDLGQIANKIADPNYVDPGKKIRAAGNDKMDKDAFMKMMLAQMKHQDPTNPLKSHEMAAQMAQFSGVEQMINMNKTLEDMRGAQKPMESFQSLNFIGKAVAGDSAKVVRVKGDIQHAFNFELPLDASSVSVKVKDAKGEVIRTVDLRDQKKGANLWTWNGQDEKGIVQPVGEYSFVVEAKSKDGKKLGVKTDFEGVITGVSQTTEGPLLLVGDQSVRLRDVRKIVDPNLVKEKSVNKSTPAPANDQKLTQDLKAAQGAGETEVKTGNLSTDVSMSREMMEKLDRETQPQTGSTKPQESKSAG